MTQTIATRVINAPLPLVFETVASIERFADVVPAIVEVEFLSEQKVGVGTRFKETRMMGKRKASTELEVTEYDEGHHVRLVSDQGGTIWDSTFTTRQLDGSSTELKLVMDAKAYKLVAKLLNPLIYKMIQGAIEKDLDCVKAHCEGVANAGARP